MISALPPEIESSMENCSITRSGSSVLNTVTELVRRIVVVRLAPAARRTTGAGAAKSGRWCSPIPNTSRPTWSASSISSTISGSRCAACTPPEWGLTSAKVNTPISIARSRARRGSGSAVVISRTQRYDAEATVLPSSVAVAPLSSCRSPPTSASAQCSTIFSSFTRSKNVTRSVPTAPAARTP